ncbi:hypothetical protein C5E06_09765 [Pseudoclavibacter sp. RFBI5]|nr:hypothetical protein C5E06_09765 [Pseudoclavibacter sp. RFBI5]
MVGFLIEYNRRTGEGHLETFPGEDGPREAFERRLVLEEQRRDTDVEIASLTSDSIETLRSTHSRYFTRGLLVG